MRGITLFLILNLTISCAYRSNTYRNNTYLNNAEAKAYQTLQIPRDMKLLMTELSGFRLDMTPRKVDMIVKRNGFKESSYNSETLADFIVMSDAGRLESGFIMLEKKGEFLKINDDISIQLFFCNGKVSTVAEKRYISKNEQKRYEEWDRKMFPGMKFEEKEGNIILKGKYEPGKFMFASISHVNRDWLKEEFERHINVFDRLRCHKEDLRKNLKY